MEGLRASVAIMDGVAGNHPHTAYMDLQKSLHQEWDFVQHVTLEIEMAFQPIEDALRNAFLPDLFKGSTSQIPRRAVTGMPCKKAGIPLPDPTQTARDNWTVSCVITGHLISALRRTAEFWSGDHSLLMGDGRDEIQRRRYEAAKTALGEAQAAAF